MCAGALKVERLVVQQWVGKKVQPESTECTGQKTKFRNSRIEVKTKLMGKVSLRRWRHVASRYSFKSSLI